MIIPVRFVTFRRPWVGVEQFWQKDEKGVQLQFLSREYSSSHSGVPCAGRLSVSGLLRIPGLFPS